MEKLIVNKLLLFWVSVLMIAISNLANSQSRPLTLDQILKQKASGQVSSEKVLMETTKRCGGLFLLSSLDGNKHPSIANPQSRQAGEKLFTLHSSFYYDETQKNLDKAYDLAKKDLKKYLNLYEKDLNSNASNPSNSLAVVDMPFCIEFYNQVKNQL